MPVNISLYKNDLFKGAWKFQKSSVVTRKAASVPRYKSNFERVFWNCWKPSTVGKDDTDIQNLDLLEYNVRKGTLVAIVAMNYA